MNVLKIDNQKNISKNDAAVVNKGQACRASQGSQEWWILQLVSDREELRLQVHFIPITKKGNAKECSNYYTIALISHTSKVMLKILQARLQQYMNRELSDVQAGFGKGRGTRDQIANIHWIMEKARESQKNIYFYFIDYAKAYSR